MRKLKKAIMSFLLALLLVWNFAGSSQNVYGKSNMRQLVGTVISVDLNTRSIQIMDRESRKIYNVKVPKNEQIKLSVFSPTYHNNRYVALERVIKGLLVDVKVVN